MGLLNSDDAKADGGGRAWVRAWACVLAGVAGVWGGVHLGFDSGVWFAGGCGCVAVGVFVGWFGGGKWGRVGGLRRVFLWLGVAALMGGVVVGRIGGVEGDRLDVLAGVQAGDRAVEQAVVLVRGVVVDGVEWSEGRREVWEPVMWAGVRGRCGVEVREVFVEGDDGGEWVESSGLVRVVMWREGVAEGLAVGDVVEVMGVLGQNSTGKRNVGDRDWGLFAAMEDRAGVISLLGGGRVEWVGQAEGVWWSVLRWREGLRGRAMGALGLDGTGWSDDAGKVVLGALLLGERTGEGREVERGFARVGVGHVLAVSGFHVALLAGMCVVLVRVVGGFGWGVRLIGGRVWVEGVVVCAVLLGMWVLVPVRVPMVRAMVLIGAVMVGRGLGRRYDTMAVLGWVAVGLMVWRPMEVFGLGFQLSVGITGLLVWMGRGAGNRGVSGSDSRLQDWKFDGGILGWVWGLLKLNGACWLVGLPAIVWHVGVVSVVGVLMAVVVALMAAVLMGVGYVQVVVGVLLPSEWGVGERTLWVVDWMADWLAGFVGWVDGVGWSSVRGVDLGVWWTVGATGLAWVVVTRSKRVSRRAKLVMLIAVVVLVGWGGVSWSMKSRVEGVRVEMVDVGDGSAYLVRSGRESFLYDCGSLDFRVGGTMERVAHRRGVRRIGAVIVSHDNVDHFNGLVELARNGVGFDRVYIGAAMDRDPSAAWDALRGELVALGAEVVVMGRGDSFGFGNGRVVCVSGGEMEEGMTDNDSSLVIRVELDTELGVRAVLMTGDIGGAGMGAIDESDLAGVVAMELPHHGSISGSAGDAARRFVGLVDPVVVLQSTGSERVDGRWSTMQPGRSWFASAVGGGAWVEIDGEGRVKRGWSVDRSGGR